MRIARRTFAIVLAASLIAWLAPAGLAAESAVLKIVPEDALAVIVINDLSKADAQIGKVAAEMQIPAPQLLPIIKARAGIQEGLDEHGSAAMALMAGEEGSGPFPIAIIPVTDYKKFIGQLQPEDANAEITKITVTGESSVAAKKGNFAILAETSKKDALKKVLDSSRSVAPIVGKMSDWIGEHDVAWVATPTGVKKGLAVARKALADVKAAMANGNDETSKLAAGNLAAYDSCLAAAEREVTAAAAAMRVDNDGGLHIDLRALFTSGGNWAKAGSDMPRGEGNQLACLPSGSFMMAFGGAMPKDFSKNFMNLSFDMLNNMSKVTGGKPLTDDQRAQMNEAMQTAMADVHSMAFVVGAPQPGQSLYSGMSGAMKVKDAKKYIADYQKLMAKMVEAFKGSALDSFMPKAATKTKVGDLDALEFSMDMSSLIAKMPNAPGAKQMLQMMFGPEGKLNVYVAAVDDTTVAISYVNSDNLTRVQAACKNPQSSLAGDPDIAQTAKLLPQSGQWAAYVSPKGIIDFVGAMVIGMRAAGGAGPGGALPAIPEFPKTPPIGIGAELSGTGFNVDIVVPGATLKGIGSYIMRMSGNRAGGPRS